MVIKSTVLWCAALLATPGVASAQSADIEVSQTVGYSTEDISAAGLQLRAFGDIVAGVRFFGEAAWGARSGGDSDVFGSAYPYGGRIQLIEAFAEKTIAADRLLLALRAGRYRTPFGISSGSDHGYMGFLRPPLVRYEGNYALSNGFLEHGVDILAGIPALSIEASVGTPADVGDARRRGGVDSVVRVQAARGALIAGVSRIQTNPYQSPVFARGRATFTGLDVRWMHGGVQARGEWIAGRPFDRTTTTGGYVDLIVHQPRMGVVTAVFRAEGLSYEAAAPFALFAQRYTAGMRIRLPYGFSSSIEIVHRPVDRYRKPPTSLDVGFTYSIRPK